MSIIEKAITRLSKTNTGDKSSVTIGTVKERMGAGRNAATVCHLNVEALSDQGYLTAGEKFTQIAEEYRKIKRPVLMNAFNKGAVHIERGNLVMVTSALPGEGKTFTAMNLALSMALEKDTTVLLVDCDVIRQKLTRLLGLENQTGLMDVLDDPLKNIGDAIVSTDIPNLRVIPSGQQNEFSAELLASDAMCSISNELSKRFSDRVIIFDSPPVLGSTHAKSLSNFAGQILIVIAEGSTSKKIVRDAASAFGEEKAIGMILNKCEFTNKNIYGYYGQDDEAR